MLDQLNRHREGESGVEAGKLKDQDVEMTDEAEVDQGSNPEYFLLYQEIKRMEQSWQDKMQRLQVDTEKGQSVSDLNAQLKECFLLSHYGVEIPIQVGDAFQKPVESKSAIFNNTHLQN